MLKIKYYIGNRQSGKSTIAKFIQYENKKSVILSPTHQKHKSWFTYGQIKTAITGRDVNTLILDEYHHATINQKRVILDIIFNDRIENIYVFTTPRYLVPRKFIYDIRDMKSHNFDYEDICRYIIDHYRVNDPYKDLFFYDYNHKDFMGIIKFFYWDLLTLSNENIDLELDNGIFFHNPIVEKKIYLNDVERYGKLF